MNFFKRLFSSKKTHDVNQPENKINAVFSDEYFHKRYTEHDITEDAVVVDGCLKMVEGYFVDNQLDRKVVIPINHPINLDQVVNDGMGFQLYCNAFKLPDNQAVFFLAFAFSEFLINNYGFKLYKDSEPEFPLRSMTLKYNHNGAVLSLYPFEYALKVLKNESTFENLLNRLSGQIKTMPKVKDDFNQLWGLSEKETK